MSGDVPWLADLSANRRWLLRGPTAGARLAAAGIDLPEGLFCVQALGGDSFLCRTGAQEFFLHEGPQSRLMHGLGLADGFRCEQGTRVFPRNDRELALGGRGAAAIVNELCTLDLHRQADRYLLTRLAHVSVWLWVEAPGLYRIGCDPSYGEYLYETLVERVRERQGDVVGYRDFYASDRTTHRGQ